MKMTECCGKDSLPLCFCLFAAGAMMKTGDGFLKIGYFMMPGCGIIKKEHTFG